MLAQANALSNQRQIRNLNPFCIRTLGVWSCLVDNGGVSEERQGISMLSDGQETQQQQQQKAYAKAVHRLSSN